MGRPSVLFSFWSAVGLIMHAISEINKASRRWRQTLGGTIQSLDSLLQASQVVGLSNMSDVLANEIVNLRSLRINLEHVTTEATYREFEASREAERETVSALLRQGRESTDHARD